MSDAPENANLAWAHILLDEVARGGVRDVVVSPGSRSAPLAIAAARSPHLRDHSVLDERSAGFFAQGLARASGRCVALVCTSGSAVANYLPAVVEAHHAEVPLLVLSADRPPENQDCGAGQTIDQRAIFGACATYFGAPLPEITNASVRHLRALVARALESARRRPAHVNLPLRDPLDPRRDPRFAPAWDALDPRVRDGRPAASGARERDSSPPWTTAHAPDGNPDAATTAELARLLCGEPHGLVVAGPSGATPAEAEAIARLAGRIGWPLLADPLSQLRGVPGAMHVAAYDAVLRAGAAPHPKRVLRFGAMPTAKPVRTFLEAHPEIEQIVVDELQWRDPTLAATHVIRAAPALLAEGVLARLTADTPPEPSPFARAWIRAGRRAYELLAAELDGRHDNTGASIARDVVASAIDGRASALFLASSMPVRDADSFTAPAAGWPRVLANRGANGIDGALASAIGAAVGTDGHTLAVLGDLALLHDVGSAALAARMAPPLTVVVVDNAGGGIFDRLPVADALDRASFERHFATPQGIDVARAIAGFGLEVEVANTRDALRASLARAAERDGPRFVCVPTVREDERELAAKLAELVASGVGDPTPCA